MTLKKQTSNKSGSQKSEIPYSLIYSVCLLFIILFSSVLPVQVLAQQIDIKAGSRVKLDVPTLSEEKLIGNISSMTDTTIFLDVGNSIYVIPVASIEEISVSTGIRAQKKQATILGIVAGGSIGSIIGYLTIEPCVVEENPLLGCLGKPTSKFRSALIGATLGGVSGALIGRLVGSTETDRWQKVPSEILLNIEPVGALQPSTHPQLTLRWTIGSRK